MNSHPRKHRSHGMALVLVLSVIALASVLGFAMLSSSALDAQMENNSAQAQSADYLAESAAQAALYYLQYPDQRPPGWILQPGYYIHTVNQTLGPDILGNFDLKVQPTSNRDEYTIHAVGRASSSSPPRIIELSAKVARARIVAATHFGGSITIPVRTNVNGAVHANGTVTNNSGLALTVVDGSSLPTSAFRIPATGKVNYYGADMADLEYICPDGTVGYAQKIVVNPLALPILSDSNPGKVYVYDNSLAPDLLVTAPVAINGTLVVRGGSGSIRTTGVTITPLEGFPALVVEQDLNIYRTNATVKANGVVYVGRNLTWTTLLGSSSGSKCEINGALLMPSGAALGTPGSGGELRVDYVENNVSVPDVSTTPQPGSSVTILSWNE